MTTNTTPVRPDPTDPLYNGNTSVRDLSRMEEAKRFLKNALWLYDNISERGTRPKNGRRPRMTLRRFAAGAPHGCVREVLDLLTDQAPYIDPIINNDIVPGRWKPKLSWFRKDSGNATVGARTATVTLIQELVPDYVEGEGTTIEAGGNCSTIEEYEYVWDAPEVIGPEAPYPQGVTYSVGGVNRDDDSGLFSYYIRKSTAVTQHLGPYVSGSSRANQIVTEIWKNLYELPADLPQEGVTIQDGKEISVRISVNDDCTYNVEKTTSKALEHDSETVCGKTLTEHVHSVTTGGNAAGLGEAPAASGGLVTRHTSRQEDDGTFTNEVQTTQELAVTCHTVTRSKTVNGIQTVVADRNQPSAPSLSGLRIGESVSYSRTDGGLYDTCKVSFTMDEITDRASSRAKTLQQSQCSDTTVQLEKGNESATAEGGILKEYSYQITELGTWQRTEQTTTEHKVDCALWQRTKSLDGVQVTTRTENAPKACMVDTELALGESIRFDRTPGDLVHITRTSLDKDMGNLVINQSDRETLYAQTYSCMEVAVGKLGCIGSGKSLTSSGKDGRVMTAQSQLTDVGSYRNTEEVVQERTVEDADVTTTKTAFGSVTKKITCSSPSVKDVDSMPLGSQLTMSKTQGGWYDITEVIQDRKEVGWSYCRNATPFQTTKVYESRAAANSCDGSAKYGLSVQSDLNDDGKYDDRIIVVAPTEGTKTTVTDEDADRVITSVAVLNASESKDIDSWSRGKTTTVRNELNDFGLWDTTKQTDEAKGPWSAVISYPTDDGVVYYVQFKRFTEVPTLNSFVGENGLPNNLVVRGLAKVDLSSDRYGLFHGSFVIYGPRTNGGSNNGGEDPNKPSAAGWFYQPVITKIMQTGVNGALYLTSITAFKHWSINDDVGVLNSQLTGETAETLAGVFPGPTLTTFKVGSAVWGYAEFYTNIVIHASEPIATSPGGGITANETKVNPHAKSPETVGRGQEEDSTPDEE